MIIEIIRYEDEEDMSTYPWDEIDENDEEGIIFM